MCNVQSVEEGVAVSVEIYLVELLRLIQIRKLEIFVHPVPPVLSETRPVVQIFNRILQERLQRLQQNSIYGKDLHWLDFFPDLLTSKGAFRLHSPVIFPLILELLKS